MTTNFWKSNRFPTFNFFMKIGKMNDKYNIMKGAIIMNDKVKQALTFVAEMIVEQYDITKNNVFKLNLKELVSEFGVKKNYTEFVVMTIYTTFDYY